ncbi:hypothetical protein UFOVP650_66 [uncultured Caudovirales phage]|uniref:Uncharacterized protein n=1 Tax=uncultured Caudovirales phage TaxID=2100421 RepID=A0A6J5N840_9CAUD|nr:hypothetical protein UFOVP650_66 [uncultured Caudovirales phage]
MNRFCGLGAELLMGGGNWASMNARGMLLNLASGADTHVKAITGMSTATPAVAIVASTTGWDPDDEIAIYNVGGTLNTNQTFRINTVPNGTTFSLKTLEDGLPVVGTGTYTSGGVAVNLTKLNNVQDANAGRVGSDATINTKTQALGNLGCAAINWAAFTGSFDALLISELVTDDTDSQPLIWVDGRAKVVLAAAASTSATSLAVQKLSNPLASGTVLRFSNGINATLSGAAAIGDRVLAVSAISGGIAVGHEAEAYKTNPGFPGSSSGSTFSLTFDNNLIFQRV